MELSVVTSPRSKNKRHVLLLVFVLWILPSLSLLQLSRSYNHSLAQVEELGIRMGELRQSLYFSEPLRVSRLNDLALDAQLVYAIRLQLESDLNSAWLSPDGYQLLFVVDQFLEKFNQFIPLETKVQDVVEDLKALRSDENISPQLEALLNEFGVVIFEAMYSEHHTSSAIYRTFDRILEKSYSLEPDEQQSMQQILAQGSTLLGEYAQLNYLVDKIRKNSVHKEIITLEAGFHQRQFYLLVAMAGISLLAIFTLYFLTTYLLALMSRRHPHTDVHQPLSEASTESAVTSNPSPVFVEQADVAREHASTGFLEETPAVVENEVNERESQPEAAVSFPLERTSLNDVGNGMRTQQVSDSIEVINKHSAQVPEPRQVAETLLVDQSDSIDIEAMLETFEGDAESVEMLLEVFIEDHTNDGQTFRQLLDQDPVAAQRVVHSLKGVAGSIKASSLAIVSASIETLMKQQHTIEENDIVKLEQAIHDAVNAAQEYLSK